MGAVWEQTECYKGVIEIILKKSAIYAGNKKKTILEIMNSSDGLFNRLDTTRWRNSELEQW